MLNCLKKQIVEQVSRFLVLYDTTKLAKPLFIAIMRRMMTCNQETIIAKGIWSSPQQNFEVELEYELGANGINGIKVYI